MQRSALSVLLIAAGLAFPVAASVLVQMDIPALIRHADQGVVHGHVLSTRSAWDPERTMIFTWVRLRVIEDLTGKNATGELLTLRVPGGRVNDVEVTMIGAPRFLTGSEVVVFLSRWSDGPLMVVGYHQGLSTVSVRAGAGALLVGGRARGMTLDDLRDAVRRSWGEGSMP